MSNITCDNIREKLLAKLNGGDLLLIVPPFGSINDITLGPHNLQAVAKAKGYKADLLYLNILLAGIIGTENYDEIFTAPLHWMIGERLFARGAYGLPSLGRTPEVCGDEGLSISGNPEYKKLFYDKKQKFDLEHYLKIEDICTTFIEETATVIAELNYGIVGCTTTAIGQTNYSVALFNALKKRNCASIRIIGGSSCDGKMAEGIDSLCTSIDYIFSGESENTFSEFLDRYKADDLPDNRIIVGLPIDDLDSVPFPNYDVFLDQFAFFLEKDPLDKLRIWYESSRGCWWAEDAVRCSFCSIHVDHYRIKSVKRMIADLKKSRELYPDKMVFMTDNIIPPTYQEELFPEIAHNDEFPAIGYQLRANLDLHDLLEFRAAKVNALLPGIETLSSNMLGLIKKGISSRQSLLIMRNAMSIGLFLDWNFIWGLPFDKKSDYEEVLRILPLIIHFQPPSNFTPLLMMRFSPYLLNAPEYEITNIKWWDVFNMIYPEDAIIDKLAAYYTGDYPSGAFEAPELIREMAEFVDIWRKRWKKSKLVMKKVLNTYIIYDNRGLFDEERTIVLDEERAVNTMNCVLYTGSEDQQWALEQKLAVVLDNWYIPVVTAAPDLLLAFEKKSSKPAGEVVAVD